MSLFGDGEGSDGGTAFLFIVPIVIIAAIVIAVVVFKVPLTHTISNFSKSNPNLTVVTTVPASTAMNFTANSIWIQDFFANLSLYRQTPLTECTNLDKFAAIRLNTLLKNYGIVHYGFAQDLASSPSLLGRSTYNSEEYFQLVTLGRHGNNTPWVPYALHTPSDQIQGIKTSAPQHWENLVSTSYSYYGYDTGNGPWILPNKTTCNVSELVGGDNLTQLYTNAGCGYFTANELWLVIELGSTCKAG